MNFGLTQGLKRLLALKRMSQRAFNGQVWSNDCKALQTFKIESNLTQVIEDYTRVINKSASLLDVVMTSSISMIESSGVLYSCISDHQPVYALVKMKASKQQHSFKVTRSFKRYKPMELGTDKTRQHNTLDLIHLEMLMIKFLFLITYKRVP